MVGIFIDLPHRPTKEAAANVEKQQQQHPLLQRRHRGDSLRRRRPRRRLRLSLPHFERRKRPSLLFGRRTEEGERGRQRLLPLSGLSSFSFEQPSSSPQKEREAFFYLVPKVGHVWVDEEEGGSSEGWRGRKELRKEDDGEREETEGGYPR